MQFTTKTHHPVALANHTKRPAKTGQEKTNQTYQAVSGSIIGGRSIALWTYPGPLNVRFLFARAGRKADIEPEINPGAWSAVGAPPPTTTIVANTETYSRPADG